MAAAVTDLLRALAVVLGGFSVGVWTLCALSLLRTQRDPGGEWIVTLGLPVLGLGAWLLYLGLRQPGRDEGRPSAAPTAEGVAQSGRSGTPP